MACICLLMLVAPHSNAEMINMHGAEDGKGDGCAGHWFGHHAGQHSLTLCSGGLDECLSDTDEGVVQKHERYAKHGLREHYRIQTTV